MQTIKALFVDTIKNDKVNIDQYINSSNCAFEMIQFILQNALSKKIPINAIKQKLFEGYKRLKDVKIPDILIKKGTTIFSVFKHLTYSNEEANAVMSFGEETDKLEEIEKQISLEDYYPSEFDMLLIFALYNVPVLLRMKGFQHTLLANKLSINISTNEKDYVYIIVIDKNKPKKSKLINFGLVSLENIGYKIPKKMINKNVDASKTALLTNITTINSYIDDSLKYLVNKITVERKLEKERKGKMKKKKITKLKAKKILS